MNKTRLLIYCWRSLQGLFCGIQSLISYSKLLEKKIHLFLLEVEGVFRTMIHCVYRRYPKIFIFSRIRLLCCLCKNISCNFTSLTMFYLKHICSKALECFYDAQRVTHLFLGFLDKMQRSSIFHVNG